jgi:hypothetical protein
MTSPRHMYWGCLNNRSGHCLIGTADYRVSYHRHPAPWKAFDGTLCVGVGHVSRPEFTDREKQIEGAALLHHLDDWTALAFWDRSIDSRYGSNSAFLLEGRFTFDEACRVAREAFPRVWARYKFEVVDVTSSDDR